MVKKSKRAVFPRMLATGLLILSAAALPLNGCSPLQDMLDGPVPEANGTTLHEHLKKKEYRQWSLWPGTTERMTSQFPHGNYQSTRVNGRAERALAKKKPLPEGAIIVKEEYGTQKEFEALSVMMKKDSGQWFFARYEGDRLIEYPDKEGLCQSCHQGKKGNDYLYLTPD